MNDERAARILLLKRKNRRKNLIQVLNFIDFAGEPFLDIADNDLFCKKIIMLLDKQRTKLQLQGEDYKKCIKKSVQLLKDTINNIEVIPKKGRLLFFRENEIEAVLINVHEIFSNLDKILELTKFLTGYGDFILVAEDLCFGLCIERTEYFYEFSTWGLL